MIKCDMNIVYYVCYVEIEMVIIIDDKVSIYDYFKMTTWIVCIMCLLNLDWIKIMNVENKCLFGVVGKG